MKIRNLSTEQLYALRKEIVLNSIYLKHYSNSFGIDEKEVYDFFMGYVDYLFEISEGKLHNDFNIFEIFEEFDNDNNLLNYWLYFTE